MNDAAQETQTLFWDSLTHVTPDGKWFGTGHDASLDRLLREMDRAGVVRAVVVALAGHISNDFVLDLCARRPERLVPGGSFNPAASPDDAAVRAAVRAELSGLSAPVLKLHPRLNHYDPLDSRLIASLEEISVLETPPRIWLDTLFHVRGITLKKPPVEAVHELVTRFPMLTFVLLHGAGSQLLHLCEAVRDCPNAYVDLSLTLVRHADSSVALDIRHLAGRFDRRLLVGSDFPEYTPGEARATFDRLCPTLDPVRRAAILGGNLQTLLAGCG